MTNPRNRRFVPKRSGGFSHKSKRNSAPKLVRSWWGKVDSNHRSDKQQIYSLSPLATREFPHMKLLVVKTLEPVDGLEPPTC